MKKFFILFAAMVLTAISANTFAQGTGIAPALGSTHTYKINGGTPVVGNTYTWSVDKDALGTPAEATDFTFGTTTDEPSIDITWLATATLNNYFLRVVEETAAGCSNEKVIKIVPVNPFYLVISTTQTSPVCYAADVAVTLDGSNEPQYDHGTVDLIYTVTPNNIGSGTSFSFSIEELLSNETNFTTSPSVSGGTLSTGIVTSSGTGAVTLTFTVTNDVFFTNTTDVSGTAADINLNIAISDGKTNQDVEDNGTGTYNVTIDANRPDTGAITIE